MTGYKRKRKYPLKFSPIENSDIYRKWQDMLIRCRPDYNCAHRYFARGISIETMTWTYWPIFCAWAKSNGHALGLTLDRRDNDKGYSPENCRFVTQAENTRNRDHKNMCEAIKTASTRFHSKPFVCVQTGQVFETKIEASRVLGLARCGIRKCLNGEHRHCGGLQFKYVNNKQNEEALFPNSG